MCALITEKLPKIQISGFLKLPPLECRMEPLAPWGEYERGGGAGGLQEYRQTPNYGGHREVGNGGNRILNEND